MPNTIALTNIEQDKFVTLIDDAGITRLAVDGKFTLQANAIVVISNIHHLIHLGLLFYTMYSDTLGSNRFISYGFTTPAVSDIDLFYDLKAAGASTFKIYENVTSITGGTAVTELNRNRSSTNTSSLEVVRNPTVNLAGATVLWDDLVGDKFPHSGSGTSGGEVEFGSLKPNTNYFLILESKENNNKCSFAISWYDEEQLV